MLSGDLQLCAQTSRRGSMSRGRGRQHAWPEELIPRRPQPDPSACHMAFGSAPESISSEANGVLLLVTPDDRRQILPPVFRVAPEPSG